MIFTPNKVVACWDTWIYFHNNTYYLYYLSGRMGEWDGFGVAVSNDGLHFKDIGQVMTTSDKNEGYFGTGSVWRSPLPGDGELFYCNFSEWRKTKKGVEQQIFFAKSNDLLHWDKLGEDSYFECDDRWYVADEQNGGRWDCIFPIERDQGGYYGYYTAKVKGRIGFGFAETEDGYHWASLEPPILDLNGHDVTGEVEVGAICKHQGKYFILLSNQTSPGFVAVADRPEGPFCVQKTNPALMNAGRGMWSAYFMRFFSASGELFVNHHSISKEKNAHNHEIISLAPIKKVWFDPGNTMYLKWWKVNEGIKGEPIYGDAERTELPEEGCVLEGQLVDGSLDIQMLSGDCTHIKFDPHDDIQITTRRGTEMIPEKRMPRPFWGKRPADIRVLVRRCLIEIYVNDFFVDTWTMETRGTCLKPEGNWKSVKKWKISDTISLPST